MQDSRIFSEVERLKDEMTQFLLELVRIPAIAPENGGEGETRKAERLLHMLKAVGFDKIQRFDAEDERVPSKKRPNIIACLNGEAVEERLWIVSHMDIVPPGEQSLWTTRPFDPVVQNGRIYGRGAEDNTQSMVSSLFAAKALKNLKIRPKRTMALCFVSDEEQGSNYGIQYLIKQKLFRGDDLVIVPDAGNANGSFIETAEKSVLWLKVRTIGKQAHASRPETGLNAHRIGMQFALTLDTMLHEKYPARDEYFEPPSSTFEPTKKEKNVDAVNIIPGEDTNCFDFRVLPSYDAEEVLNTVTGLAEDFEKKTGARISVEVLQKTIAGQPTKPDAQIAVMLKKAIKMARGIDAKVGGIGGGTCAAYFRRAGVPAVVWSTVDEVAHEPNEYTKIENLVHDSQVFAYLATM
jgi:succinyl-diaminopimelate desuccinylase